VIGLIGSPVWVPARHTCYGWELVELIRLLKDQLARPIRGVLIGDGSGVPILEQRCQEYGILDLMDFAGRIPYGDLPAQLRRMDVCLSTQTNDVIGQVRTTGKLPLYLAAGRFILASRVGEAARVLPPEMLVDFAGESDPDYPAKLAERIVQLVAQGNVFTLRPECVALAEAHFRYDLLAGRLHDVLHHELVQRAEAF
jgi:glycosyltransferase involved in cell wall biosynthesis